MERHAVQRDAVGSFVFLDFDPVGIIRSDFVQRDNMHKHEANQCKRQDDDMQRKKAIEGDVGNRVVAANIFHQCVADDGYCAKQRDDDLRSPVGHLTPGQQVTGKPLGH